MCSISVSIELKPCIISHIRLSQCYMSRRCVVELVYRVMFHQCRFIALLCLKNTTCDTWKLQLQLQFPNTPGLLHEHPGLFWGYSCFALPHCLMTGRKDNTKYVIEPGWVQCT